MDNDTNNYNEDELNIDVTGETFKSIDSYLKSYKGSKLSKSSFKVIQYNAALCSYYPKIF